MIVNFGYRVAANEINRSILWRILIDFSEISGAAKSRCLIVDIRENNRYLGCDWRCRHDFRYFFRANFEYKSPIAVFFRFSIELSARQDNSRRWINLKEILRPFRDAVRNSVVYSFVAVDRPHCNVN